MKSKIGVNAHFFHLFDIERMVLMFCWKYGSRGYIKANGNLELSNVCLHNFFFLNDYVKHNCWNKTAN